jgi:hypothetical protein
MGPVYIRNGTVKDWKKAFLPPVLYTAREDYE